MPRVAFFTTNLLARDDGSTSVGRCTLDDRTAFLTDRPGEAASASETPGGWFDVHDGNAVVSIDSTTYTVANGLYSHDLLARAITDAVVLGGGSATFVCDYLIQGNFRFSDSAGSFTVDFSGLSNSIASTIGFADSNLSGSSSYTGPELRPNGSDTVVEIDTRALSPSGSAADPDMLAVILYGDDDTDFSDVRFYGASTSLAASSQAWRTIGETVTLSPRGVRSDARGVLINPVQVGYRTSGTPRRYWRFQWTHADESTVHRVGIVYAAAALQSDYRTLAEIQEHECEDRTAGVETLYPTEALRRWRVVATAERWQSDDWDAVWAPLSDHGRGRLAAWALNWNDITAGTLNAEDEADAGFLFLGRLRSVPTIAYSGSESAALSGEVEFVQEV